MADPYLAAFEHVELVALTIKSHKHGKYLRAVIEIPLDSEVDMNGLAHELYQQPARMTIERLPAIREAG